MHFLTKIKKKKTDIMLVSFQRTKNLFSPKIFLKYIRQSKT